MKLLRNPVVVGILALLAVAMLVYNVVWPMLGNVRWRTAPTAAAARAATPTAKGSSVEQTVAAIKSLLGKEAPAPVVPRLELVAVQTGAARWASAPRRDPFQSKLALESPTAQLLKLKGVWRQTDSILTVINKKLLAEGDSILDYKVDKIETDQVWVTGPYGREALFFNMPLLSTNDFPATKLAELPL